MTFILKNHIVWSQELGSPAPHNGWPGLAKYKNKWYIACTESAFHGSPTKNIRILESIDDGDSFESVALITPPDAPAFPGIWEPTLRVTPNGKLRLQAWGNDGTDNFPTYVWVTTDPEDFGTETMLGPPINAARTWGGSYGPNGKYYLGGGKEPDRDKLTLFESTDVEGKSFTVKVDEFAVPNTDSDIAGGEVGFGFLSDKRMIAISRNSTFSQDDIPGRMYVSTDDTYTKFTETTLDRRTEHAELLVLNDDTILLGTRGFSNNNNKRFASVHELDINNSTMTIRHRFRNSSNSGDGGRPSFVYEKDRDIISIAYYNGPSHLDTNIYFTQISKPFKNQ